MDPWWEVQLKATIYRGKTLLPRGSPSASTGWYPGVLTLRIEFALSDHRKPTRPARFFPITLDVMVFSASSANDSHGFPAPSLGFMVHKKSRRLWNGHIVSFGILFLKKLKKKQMEKRRSRVSKLRRIIRSRPGSKSGLR